MSLPPPYSLSLFALFVLGALFNLSVSPGAVAEPPPPHSIWRPYADDIELGELSRSTRTFFSSRLTLVRTSLSKYRVGVVRAAEFGSKRSDVKSMCRLSKALIGINANFFDEQGDPLGLIISRGILQQRIHKGGTTLTGIFQATRRNISILNRQTFFPENALEALQAGPRLLGGGAPVSGIRESLTPSKRAGVCIDKVGRLIFYAVSSRFIGLDIEELQEALLLPEIACVDALNLDGGGSVQMYISEKLPGIAKESKEFYISGDDEVPVMLGLFLK